MTELMFLDTIRLDIELWGEPSPKKYPFTDKNAWILTRESWGCKYLFNKKERKKIEGHAPEYIPTVEYCRRAGKGMLRHELRIEFSVPKLLNLHNFWPVPVGRIDEIFDKLEDVLVNIYGFQEIDRDDLEQATLSRIDCSSVVRFKSQIALNKAMHRIRATDLNSLISIDTPSFSSDAHGVSIGCDSWQFCFYDKSKEYKSGLKKMLKESWYPEGKIIDDADNKYNIHFLRGTVKYEEKGAVSHLPLNVITAHKANNKYMQCELRLNRKHKIARALKKIGEKSRPLTLRDAIDSHIPQRILQYHWQMIIDGLPKSGIVENSMHDIGLKLMGSGLTPKKLAEAIGNCYLLKEYDAQELKPIYKELHGRNSWKRLKDSVQGLPGLQGNTESIQPITNAIFGLEETTSIDDDDECITFSFFIGSITITSCTKNQSFYSHDLIFCRVRHISIQPRPPPALLTLSQY